MAMITNFDPRGMGRKQLESFRDSGQLSPAVRASVEAKLAGMPKQGGDLNVSGGFNMADIRAKLQGTQKTFLDTQNKMIDRNADRAGEQGLSDMISSGLAGTTAVGGMRAAVGESAGFQKADLASRAQMQTDQLALQYATLASQNLNAASNREFAGGGGIGGGSGGGGGGPSSGGGASGAAEQLMSRPQVGGGAFYGKDYGAAKDAELARLRGETQAPQTEFGPTLTGAGSESSGMSYKQWWGSLSDSEKKRLNLTSNMAPGGPWQWMGEKKMPKNF